MWRPDPSSSKWPCSPSRPQLYHLKCWIETRATNWTEHLSSPSEHGDSSPHKWGRLFVISKVNRLIALQSASILTRPLWLEDGKPEWARFVETTLHCDNGDLTYAARNLRHAPNPLTLLTYRLDRSAYCWDQRLPFNGRWKHQSDL